MVSMFKTSICSQINYYKRHPMETLFLSVKKYGSNVSLSTQSDQCLTLVASTTLEISVLLSVQLSVPKSLLESVLFFSLWPHATVLQTELCTMHLGIVRTMFPKLKSLELEGYGYQQQEQGLKLVSLFYVPNCKITTKLQKAFLKIIEDRKNISKQLRN